MVLPPLADIRSKRPDHDLQIAQVRATAADTDGDARGLSSTETESARAAREKLIQRAPSNDGWQGV